VSSDPHACLAFRHISCTICFSCICLLIYNPRYLKSEVHRSLLPLYRTSTSSVAVPMAITQDLSALTVNYISRQKSEKTSSSHCKAAGEWAIRTRSSANSRKAILSAPRQAISRLNDLSLVCKRSNIQGSNLSMKSPKRRGDIGQPYRTPSSIAMPVYPTPSYFT
jgi:hypothetical protein